MLKLGDLKPGDLISVNDDGLVREGTVVKISHEDHQALVDNGIQEFWYNLDELKSIPLDDNQLARLGFTKEKVEAGIKYKKDSFRLMTAAQDDFSHVEMWWREDRRHFNVPLGVHELQNLHLSMTKVPLEKH